MTEPPAEQLQKLHDRIRGCTRCRLCETRTQAVPGEGPAGADVMFIGEGPGAKEDRSGKPFCGMAGTFFDALLKENGLNRDQVYITSSVKCRPPKNRNPKPDEYSTCCSAWLEHQIELVRPRVIVLFGKIAAAAVLDEKRLLRDVHGRFIEKDGRSYLITYHPAAGMRFPDIREKMRDDFKKLQP